MDIVFLVGKWWRSRSFTGRER